MALSLITHVLMLESRSTCNLAMGGGLDPNLPFKSPDCGLIEDWLQAQPRLVAA